eukprot:IDg9559t1
MYLMKRFSLRGIRCRSRAGLRTPAARSLSILRTPILHHRESYLGRLAISVVVVANKFTLRSKKLEATRQKCATPILFCFALSDMRTKNVVEDSSRFFRASGVVEMTCLLNLYFLLLTLILSMLVNLITPCSCIAFLVEQRADAVVSNLALALSLV